MTTEANIDLEAPRSKEDFDTPGDYYRACRAQGLDPVDYVQITRTYMPKGVLLDFEWNGHKQNIVLTTDFSITPTAPLKLHNILTAEPYCLVQAPDIWVRPVPNTGIQLKARFKQNVLVRFVYRNGRKPLDFIADKLNERGFGHNGDYWY